ncbi:hypothetical protein ACFE04_024006 [Oxalis oulophora]
MTVSSSSSLTHLAALPRASLLRPPHEVKVEVISFPINHSRINYVRRSTFHAPHKVLCMRESQAPVVVTKDSWEDLILKSDVPVLVEFYASWCGPCRMVDRIIDEISGEYAGKLKCFVLNTDKDLHIAEKYEVKAVPVVLMFKNGEKRETVVGTMPKEFYISAIERVMQS